MMMNTSPSPGPAGHGLFDCPWLVLDRREVDCLRAGVLAGVAGAALALVARVFWY